MDSETSTKSQSKPPVKAIYSIKELPNGDKVWRQIGVAFVNRDGSLNLKIDFFPVGADPQIQIRDFKVTDEKAA